MARMRIASGERARVKWQCLRVLATLRLDPARMQLISGFVDTYLPLNEQEAAQFHAALEQETPPEQEKVMQIVTSWMREGMEQGLQQGRREEASTLVVRQLNRRVGPIAEALAGRVRDLPLHVLEDLSEALLDFTSRSDLETWLAKHDNTA